MPEQTDQPLLSEKLENILGYWLDGSANSLEAMRAMKSVIPDAEDLEQARKKDKGRIRELENERYEMLKAFRFIKEYGERHPMTANDQTIALHQVVKWANYGIESVKQPPPTNTDLRDMNKINTVIELLERFRPCDHPEYEECGLSGIWRTCHGCGLQFEAKRHDAIRERVASFDQALSILRSLPEQGNGPYKFGYNNHLGWHVSFPGAETPFVTCENAYDAELQCNRANAAYQAGCLSAVLAHPPQEGKEEELQRIANWCEKIFGPITASRLAERAQEEMDELIADTRGRDEWTEEAMEEAADVVIVLSRVPNLMEHVRAKMEINRKREWHFMGDGTGYHIKQDPGYFPLYSEPVPPSQPDHQEQ